MRYIVLFKSFTRLNGFFLYKVAIINERRLERYSLSRFVDSFTPPAIIPINIGNAGA